MRFNSIKFKISILYIAILGLILISYSSFLYLSLRYTLYGELDNELSGKAQELAGIIDSYVDVLGYEAATLDFAVRKALTLEGEYPGQEKLQALDLQWEQKVDKLDLKEDYINFLDSNGRTLFHSNNIATNMPLLSLKELSKLKEGAIVFKSIKFEKRNLRVINTPFSYENNAQYIIQISTSLKPVIHLLQIRLTHILISIPIFLILASFFGRLFASRILRPVVEITKTASKITHEDLSSRVKAEQVDEEMRYLVNAFNDMISRLEQSFKYIADFSSQVAHDLKTPLAIIRGESDIALRKNRSMEEYQRVIKTTSEEAERMLRFIDDLLLLTKLEYRPELLKFEGFNFGDFLWEIHEQSKILAAQKNIEINAHIPSQEIYIKADKQQLRRLLFNLLDNAIKFTDERGKIAIDVKAKEKEVEISVIDNGIGIAKEDLPKIFDKFFHINRLDKNNSSGAGLGLNIALCIVKAHHGDIKVESIVGSGSTFTVSLPIA